MLRGNLADLAATKLASEPTLRTWLKAEPDQDWIIKRGSNGIDYELDLEGAAKAFRAREEKLAQAARDRAAQIAQFALDLGINVSEQSAEVSLADRKHLLEEQLMAMKVAKELGELVSYNAAISAFGDVLLRFRRQAQTFAARLSKKVDLRREQIAAIDALMEADLVRMADWMERMEADLGDGGDQLDRSSPPAPMEDASA